MWKGSVFGSVIWGAVLVLIVMWVNIVPVMVFVNWMVNVVFWLIVVLMEMII